MPLSYAGAECRAAVVEIAKFEFSGTVIGKNHFQWCKSSLRLAQSYLKLPAHELEGELSHLIAIRRVWSNCSIRSYDSSQVIPGKLTAIEVASARCRQPVVQQPAHGLSQGRDLVKRAVSKITIVLDDCFEEHAVVVVECSLTRSEHKPKHFYRCLLGP